MVVRLDSRRKYLFPAAGKHGRLIKLMLADQRNTRAEHRFLGKNLDDHALLAAVPVTTRRFGFYP
jgi:transposase-like protein